MKRWTIEVFLAVSYSTKKKPAMTHHDECPAINDLTAPLMKMPDGPDIALIRADVRSTKPCSA